MIIKINKDYFKKLSLGVHSIRVNFTDGYAEGTFEVGNKISFTIIDTVFTATEGMTWGDWIASYGEGTSGNGILWVSPIDRGSELYLDCRDHNQWYNGFSLGADEDAFFDSNDIRQTLVTPIVNGMTYGRSSDAPC